MKTYSGKTGASYLMIALFLSAILIYSCGGGGGQTNTNKRQLEEAKQKTVQNINKLKNDIQDRIAYVDGEIEQATGEIKDNLQEARAELEEQRNVLNEELKKIQDATIDTWNDVVAKSTGTLAQVKSKTNEVSKKVRGWLDGEGE
jgi:DNA repair exonuclease SbcCD ATPase subunit